LKTVNPGMAWAGRWRSGRIGCVRTGALF